MCFPIPHPEALLEESRSLDSITQSYNFTESCSTIPEPMSKWNIDALTALQRDLKNRLSLIELPDFLERAAGGFMTRAEKMHVCGQSDQREKVECIITLLQGKGDRDFDIFIKLLMKSGNEVWAGQLQKKAKKLKEKSQKGVCT